jgi:hypothetical protein
VAEAACLAVAITLLVELVVVETAEALEHSQLRQVQQTLVEVEELSIAKELNLVALVL